MNQAWTKAWLVGVQRDFIQEACLNPRGPVISFQPGPGRTLVGILGLTGEERRMVCQGPQNKRFKSPTLGRALQEVSHREKHRRATPERRKHPFHRGRERDWRVHRDVKIRTAALGFS